MKISSIVFVFLTLIVFVLNAKSNNLDVAVISDYSFLFSNGRYLGIWKNGGEVKYGIITVGADTRIISGHGKSSDSTYKSTGNAQNISIDILPVDKNNDIGLQLQFDHRRINRADIESGPPSSHLEIHTSYYIDNGLSANLSKKIKKIKIYLLVGIYNMNENGREIGTAKKLSAGFIYDMSKRYFVEARIDGFRDDFSKDVHYSQCLSGKIGYKASSNFKLIVSGDINFRGVPIAGSDLSTVSAIGEIFNNSKFHTSLSGIVGIRLVYNF